jgi:hypothetical protein
MTAVCMLCASKNLKSEMTNSDNGLVCRRCKELSDRAPRGAPMLFSRKTRAPFIPEPICIQSQRDTEPPAWFEGVIFIGLLVVIVLVFALI